MMTDITGDNEDTNGCKIDQRIATGDDPRQGLRDEFGNPVTAVKDEWIVGIASSEIPTPVSVTSMTTAGAPR